MAYGTGMTGMVRSRVNSHFFLFFYLFIFGRAVLTGFFRNFAPQHRSIVH